MDEITNMISIPLHLLAKFQIIVGMQRRENVNKITNMISIPLHLLAKFQKIVGMQKRENVNDIIIKHASAFPHTHLLNYRK